LSHIIEKQQYARALRRVMNERDVMDVDLARTVGSNRKTVADWRNGRALPPTATALRIAAALDDMSLYHMVSRRRESTCDQCGATLVSQRNRVRRWCNATCRDRFRFGREPKRSSEQAAIAEMCRQCEPDGACFTAECPLRAWSPLPLADDEVMPMAPRRGRRWAA
jgi:DNA-binding XRE family transcriptional regulator